MKKILFIMMLYSTAGFGQGWIGQKVGSSNRLYPVNDSLKLTPINVGIGTSSPTTQFHTTGSVRLAGITNNDAFNRILTQDTTGVLFWRNASSLGTQSGWSLTGNAGTNPATNFLGTTDANRLVFKTSNIERATILANGFTGIGTSNPRARFHVQGDTTAGSMGFPYEAEVFERSGDHKFGIYSTVRTTNIATAGGASLTLGYTNFRDNNGNFPGYEMQFGGFSDSAFFLRFNALFRNTAGLVTQPRSNIMLLDENGRVGINLQNGFNGDPVIPGANLHVNGTVRFQNLPTGAGCPLVIDGSGNVFATTCSTFTESTAGDKSSTTIAKLESRISTLEAQLNDLRSMVNALAGSAAGAGNKLFSVFPNPANGELSIEPNTGKSNTGYKNAVVRDLNGKTVLDKISFQTSIRIPLGKIQNGAYLVSIYDKDGKLIQTDRLIVQQ